jgi:hypothetical protein
VKRERLFARIPAPRVGTHGIADQDVARVQVVPELVEEILDCLRSDDKTDVVFGLYFAERLKPRPDFAAAVTLSLSTLTSMIRGLLTHSDRQVRADAVRAFVAFRKGYDDYATKMREFLRSPDPQTRREALRAAPTFLSSKQLDILLPFRDDPEFGETGGMGGPQRYDIRDFALEIAEHIAGRKFDSGDCLERRDGTEISWRSWNEFTQWLEGKKRWSLFRK